MEKYISYCGLRPAGKNEAPDMALYAVNNPDGSCRWIWNATCKTPLFLGFYAASSLKSRLISLAFRGLFFVNLQHRIYRRSLTNVKVDSEHPLAGFLKTDFALFTGTEGPNRKLILYAGTGNEKKRFIKIAISKSSEQLIDNECDKLQLFGQGNHFRTPEVTLISKGIIALEDMRAKGYRVPEFSGLHAQVVAELMQKAAKVELPVNESPVFTKTNVNLHSLREAPGDKLPGNLVRKLGLLSAALQASTLTHTAVHGDFTPWNCFRVNDKLHLYDFELAQLSYPYGFDAFHFVFQQGIFVEHLSWKEIKTRMQAAFETLCAADNRPADNFSEYLKAYLLINIAYYAELYARQENWHLQIYWQLNTWNDALSDMLSDAEPVRSLLITDVFAWLKYSSYVAVKFPEEDPATLSPYADIDLMLHKADAVKLFQYLQHHSLVKNVSVSSFSHMMSTLLQLTDGSILALDMIWKLKRKAVQFMDTEAVLNGGTKNAYGVKVMSSLDLQSYLIRFYGLNASKIPTRHHVFFETPPPTFDYKALRNRVRNESYNKGISGLKNKIAYMKDTSKKSLSQRGIIITFSGVDGAGKSTIIEQVRYQIEKKLRRDVVVIRHRPSLLPILSAFTYGKEKAEQRAASTLPRQGQNKSTLSSLLRFAYYYSDYLFGQFYVWMKYVARGKVVLYDRYYFDFINDSVRSNIRLPKGVSKAGYSFLMQPHLNFFLYADAATILSRKKELDEQAITQLTKEYLELFGQLSRRGNDRYFPIENIVLEDTVGFIVNKVQSKLLDR